MLFKVLKVLAVLVILGFAALVGYAYVGDLSANQTEIREPVTIEVN